MKNKPHNFDEANEFIQTFAQEFKTLVRKYMPEYPNNETDAILLARMQEQTSCYNPWIWAD